VAVIGALTAVLLPALPALASAATDDAPTLTVSPATGVAQSGASVTVTGSHFNGSNPTGVYVVFGPKNSDYWTNASVYSTAVWVHPNAPSTGSQAPMAPDGSFSLTLPSISARYSAGGVTTDCTITQCYVLTFAAHGSPDRSQDTFAPVSFAATAATSTSFSVKKGGWIAYGLPVTVSVTGGPGAPSGTVTLSEGGKTLGTLPVVGGKAEIPTDWLSRGKHTIRAAFASDSPDAGNSSVTRTFTVGKGSTKLSLTSSANPAVAESVLQFTASLRYQSVSRPTVAAHGSVTFSVDGRRVCLAKPVTSGTATSCAVTSLAPGKHTITAKFTGDANFLSSSGTLVQRVTVPVPS
jgi:hypothetical protein